MKTLVIHPKDSSTTFLTPLYENIKEKTVITGNVTRKELIHMIRENDRVMMLGHGWTMGLFNTKESQFLMGGLVIDHTMVSFLAEKEENIFIWCRSDGFVDNYPQLKGFYTDMFISEVLEAEMFQITATQEQVDKSNNNFVEILAKYINEDTATMHEKVREEYAVLAESNEVAEFNNEGMYLK